MLITSSNLIFTLFINALYAFPILVDDDIESDWNPFKGSRQVQGLPFHDFFHAMMTNPYPMPPLVPISEQSSNAILDNEINSEADSAIILDTEGDVTTSTTMTPKTIGLIKTTKGDIISKTNLATDQHRSASQQKTSKLEIIQKGL